jgi:hypothetical protein
LTFGEKFADAQLGDWNTKEICRFVICGLNKKIIENWGVGTCPLKHPRDLQICESGMSPRTCGFADL